MSLDSIEKKHTVENRVQTAWIVEEECIGCFRCVKACPENAIVGASRYMHTVIQSLCTGCEECMAPCPVDCIEMKAL
ncbi:RnfABCDGE type electron transport complex subunit B [Ferrovum sp. PN-J185]|uniref:RnfABCDGE type electron transport complex subunit B n=1 Tax=Ferrovum sp. PN-J185 TaxID=1356306 RepID=UPI001E45488B|nr:RnfABCDGE type electron transport complex subunit B [Ferrovum sp. PN-J185]MCC6067642.1 RnfABCDGE type electron transport complex subunit B [Ferrovum sp. PN-J185]